MNEFTEPFRHWVQDDFIAPNTVRAINNEWPVDGWREEDGKAQRKWSQPITSGTALRLWSFLVSERFCRRLSRLTGIPGLYSDKGQFGGGHHSTPPGGFLGLHTDFQYLPNGHRRRLNLLIYLNEVWRPAWGGALELHGDSTKCIEPIGGRAVLFETTKKTWHGHPRPTNAPVHRRSLALYYYTPDNGTHDKTIYRKR